MLEGNALSVVGQDRCNNLRWKGLFIEAEWDPTIAPGDRTYWCQHTYTCLGPDGQVVDEYECNPARGCYKEL